MQSKSQRQDKVKLIGKAKGTCESNDKGAGGVEVKGKGKGTREKSRQQQQQKYKVKVEVQVKIQMSQVVVPSFLGVRFSFSNV